MLNDYMNSLNPEQKRAVLSTEGPLLILAGAGSGKTRVLTHRIAYLLENGVRAFNIFAITFTNKAAREMKERASALTPEGSKVWISTFHSSCVQILHREIENIGYSKHFTIYDSEDSERLIKNIIKTMGLNDKMYPPKWVMSEISAQKDKLISPEVYTKMIGDDYKFGKVARIYTAYQRHLKENNCLDFDDLIFKTVELFRKCPQVLEKWQDRFHYIMVDEYQDTNASQYELIRLLAGKYGNLCVVGDDDQSIYGWRGADIHNILNFEKDFPGTTTIRLERNYRSSENILNAANSVIKNNYMRKSKTLRTEAEPGENICFYKADNDRDEANFISRTIAEGVENGAAYSDFAILYRNNALSRVIEEGLVKADIPYRLFGGTRFYDRKEIKDVMGYLKALYNPNDDMAVRRIINVPKRGIGDATINKAAQAAEENGISLYSALMSADAVPGLKTKLKQINGFAALMLELGEIAEKENVDRLIEAVLDKSGYRSELEAENTEDAKNRLLNLEELVSKAVEFAAEHEEATLADFLEEVALVADVDGYTEGADTAVLMTLHSSKGLEFPTVFIAGFEEGIFPSYRAVMSGYDKDIEEERRLCYVGITRAKKQLYLTAARERMQYGRSVFNLPSRFLKEIPASLIENKENENVSLYSENTFARSEYVQKNRFMQRPAAAYSMPTPKNVTLDFEVGDTIRHMKYGIGTVLEITPAGADYEITVEFERAGRKKLLSTFANLKKL